MELQLSVPDMTFFPSYIKALEEGFAYGSGDAYTADEIAEIKTDPEKHLVGLNTQKSGLYLADDGVTTWPRVYQEIIWITSEDDGQKEFIGAMNFRPQIHETLEKIGGHLGYSIRPSARGKGLMTKALGLLLTDNKRLAQVDRDHLVVGADADNEPSIKTILRFNGKHIGQIYFAPQDETTDVYHIPLVQS